MNFFEQLGLTLLSPAQASTSGSSMMPAAVTEVAGRVDHLYEFLLIVSTISCLLLIGGMIYFSFKYRRQTDKDKTAYITHNTFLEFLWSFIPLVIFMVVFGWGFSIYHEMRHAPDNAFEVHVTARQWSWTFEFKSGKTEGNNLTVPVGVPIKFIMTSKDVLHSFFLPSMRIKQDVIPGRYTFLWFKAEKLGEFNLFCAEYCGANHSKMIGKINVVTMPEFEKYLRENDDNLPAAERGKKLAGKKGCTACHSTDGSVVIGPSWKGIWGKEESFEDGSTAKVDENYIVESIKLPAAKIVKGFNTTAMPPMGDQISDDEISAIIEYIKELK